MKPFSAHSLAAVMLMTLSCMSFADQDDHKKPQANATQQVATAVPEPEVYGMMLAGLGIVGFAARRKLKAKAIKAEKK